MGMTLFQFGPLPRGAAAAAPQGGIFNDILLNLNVKMGRNVRQRGSGPDNVWQVNLWLCGASVRNILFKLS